MVTDPYLGVVSRVVDFDGLALVAQVDRALVAHVVDLAAVPHDLDVVQIPNHVQRALVGLDQNPVLVSDDLQIVPVVFDPDALLVPEHILGLPNWHDHFSCSVFLSDGQRSDLPRVSIATDERARRGSRHI